MGWTLIIPYIHFQCIPIFYPITPSLHTAKNGTSKIWVSFGFCRSFSGIFSLKFSSVHILGDEFLYFAESGTILSSTFCLLKVFKCDASSPVFIVLVGSINTDEGMNILNIYIPIFNFTLSLEQHILNFSGHKVTSRSY